MLSSYAAHLRLFLGLMYKHGQHFLDHNGLTYWKDKVLLAGQAPLSGSTKSFKFNMIDRLGNCAQAVCDTGKAICLSWPFATRHFVRWSCPAVVTSVSPEAPLFLCEEYPQKAGNPAK